MKRSTRRYRQSIAAPPRDVFPLLCPVHEREWLDGWACTMIHSDSGVAEKACIFVTESDGAPAVWTVTEHRPPDRIAFFQVRPGRVAIDIGIDLEPELGGRSRVDVAYTMTALTGAGERDVADWTEGVWNATMSFWERSMNHWLETGEILARGES